MANRWTIQGKRTVDDEERIVDIAVLRDLELHDEWMNQCFVTGNVYSEEPIDWHFDDYLTYRGEVFSISYDPNVVKKARRGTYGEGFTYDNIRLYSLGYKTRNYGFKDVVLYDGKVTYTSLATFSFFCASIEDFADRMQANLNREVQSDLVSGWTVLTPDWTKVQTRCPNVTRAEWEQYFEDGLPSGETDVNIDIDKQNCFEVMKYSYEKFGLAYYVVGTTIVIGGKTVHLNTGSQNIFRYGKGLGLYEIERTSSDDIEIVTKLFAYGSEQNLPLNYYANVGKRFYATVTDVDADGNATLDIDWKESYFSNPPELIKVGEDDSNNLLIDEEAEDIYRRTCFVDAEWAGLQSLEPVELGVYEDGNYAKVSKPDVPAGRQYSVGTVIYFVGGVNKNGWPADHTSTIGDAYPATLSVNRLMLPGFPLVSLNDWVVNNEDAEIRSLASMYIFSEDKFDPWIKSKNIEIIGLFEGTANYDGSQQKEIYPTITNTDACTVVVGSNVTDNGYVTNAGPFTIEVSDGSLDWKSALRDAPSKDDVAITMTSGFCTGRDFKVVSAAKSETTGNWVLTLQRHTDSSMNRLFPYHDNDVSHYCQILGTEYGGSGDTFVVTGIQMPDAYVEAAAKKLLIAACGYLDKRDHMRYTYLPKIDETFMQRDHDKRGAASYHDTIRSGMTLEFEDTDLGIWHSPFIDNLTIKEDGNNGIPTYDVVLRDEKEKTALEKMAERIEELTGATQVVERQTYPSMNVDYPEWVAGTPYYYQTLNTNPNPDISTSPYIETSYVWHRGKKWMCLRTLTNEEPMLGCSDWKVVEGDTGYAIEFVSSNGYSFYQGHVSTTVDAFLYWGTEDITDQVAASQFNWTRSSESGKTEADVAWDAMAAHQGTKQLTLTDADMPTAWSRTNKAIFTLTVTVSEDVHVVNNIIA